MRSVALLAAATFVCTAADLPARIRHILAATPEARQCFWGIRVTDAQSGRVIFSQNEARFFVPASNTKLFTTSLALRRLGPDYRFRTRLEADARPDSLGRVKELRLIGGGDPNLSGRLLPYDKDDPGSDPLAVIKSLADRAVAQGLRVIDGDVVGDDSAYFREPFPDGWAVDDPIYEYGAPVSALTLNDNAFKLTVYPALTAGAPASLSLDPALEYLTVHNRTRTVAVGETKLHYDRIPGSRELIVTGTVLMTAEPVETLLAIDDPALFAAHALRSVLEDRGVRITGVARAVHRDRGEEAPNWKGVEIAAHESAPLSLILQVINKVSQNLHTELLLCEIARTKYGVGSRKEGLQEVGEYLQEIGVQEGQWNFEDASGLSRLTLVTPLTLSKVLTEMYRSPLRADWLSTFPIGGEDGTLEKRFRQASDARRIHAKTGSLSHVGALSGYVLRRDGRTYVFTIFVNNYNASSLLIRDVIDKIALALLR
jgi:D-alanyl-D-alanine carboxypeptidase/D-alanyl-D-alanine-endopeptidase (penicillin-binding protein 4)